MKRLLPFFFSILSLLLLLGSCASRLVPSSYTVVQKHTTTTTAHDTDAVTVANYDELHYAMLNFVETRQTTGIIQSTGYDGNASTDAATAAHDIWNNDPDGAYAIDFIATDCRTILTRSEITVSVTYRDGILTPEEIPYVRGKSGVRAAVESALDEQKSSLTVRVSNYPEKLDYTDLVSAYCIANPLTVMEHPKVSASVYPEDGSVRIAELRLDYAHDTGTLAQMQTEVNAAVGAAVGYVSHCTDEAERADLLVRYLLERFAYRFESTSTPAYSLLCQGVTDNRTMAQIFAELCEQAGLDCQVVSGYRNGEPYHWNILKLGETYSHADLFQQAKAGEPHLMLRADRDMTSYSWDREKYPACTAPATTAEVPTELPTN